METIVSGEEKVIFTELSKATEHELSLMGGKASTLARLLKRGLPVPEGAVVFQEPASEEDLRQIHSWWETAGGFPVAVRSSASGEDSADFSYAGQFLTLLHINTKADLTAAINACFQAVKRKSSQAYASHFERAEIPMHILLQRMVNSKFSGVYFSVDPRNENSSWLVEVVEGQGEQLVSGQVNPFRFNEIDLCGKTAPTRELPHEWKQEYLAQIVHWGQEVEKTFGYKVDMEWAIDETGRFWVLQSRPITAHGRQTTRSKVVEQEWQRILSESSEDSVWDGHTFAEWTGVPTELTYDLWQKTFQKNHAFDLALKQIGYEGFHDRPDEHGLLDRVFGRAYLNLKYMEPIYFGEAPYHLEPHPRPHLEFDWKKLSPAMLLRAPAGIARMGLVAWNIQTGRQELSKKALDLAKSAPISSKDIFAIHQEPQQLPVPELLEQIKVSVDLFSQKSMQATFLLTLLIESTMQGLLALLEKDLGAEKAALAISHLTGSGLQTVATEMQHELSAVEGSGEKWLEFLKHYGHRGVGELELSHPRWIEKHQPGFKKLKGALHESIVFDSKNVGLEHSNILSQSNDAVLEDIISHLSAVRRPVFKQEWTELQHLMQIREEIKMEVMKPYAQIRWLVLALAEKIAFGSDIFWLKLEEILSLNASQDLNSLLMVAQERKNTAEHLKSIDLPMLFSKQQLKADFDQIMKQSGSSDAKATDLDETVVGISLSSGIASGIVHIVDDPAEEDLDSWPDNYVLVADATDPGWTPLFERAQAVVVARGGVLSHCAIVAREMNLPAVGEIRGANHLFKEGERVWVDGNSGTVRRSH